MASHWQVFLATWDVSLENDPSLNESLSATQGASKYRTLRHSSDNVLVLLLKGIWHSPIYEMNAYSTQPLVNPESSPDYRRHLLGANVDENNDVVRIFSLRRFLRKYTAVVGWLTLPILFILTFCTVFSPSFELALTSVCIGLL